MFILISKQKMEASKIKLNQLYERMLLLVSLVVISHSFQQGDIVSYSDAYVQFLQYNQTTLFAYNSSNQCSKIEVGQSNLYHLSKQNVLQIWSMGDISAAIGSIDNSGSIYNISDFAVSSNQNQIMFSNRQNGSNSIIYYSLNLAGLAQFNRTQNTFTAPSSIFYHANITYKFYRNMNNSGRDVIIKQDNSMVTVFNLYNHNNASIVFSPNFKLALAWTNCTQIFIYNTSDFNLLKTFNNSMTVTQLYSTNTIQISPDSRVAIIQHDYGQVTRLNLQTFSSQGYLLSYHIITGTPFITNDIVMVICADQTILWQLSTNLQPHLNGRGYLIRATTYKVDLINNYFFTCQNNIVKKYNINVTYIPQMNTNQINNSAIVPNNQQNQNQTLPYCFQVNFTDNQNKVYNELRKSLVVVNQQIITKSVIFAMSTPFTIYFLTFLNFISFSSIYILLNIELPSQIYEFLSMTYVSSNANLLQIFQINPNVSPLSRQMISNKRVLSFGITSDLFSSMYLTLFLVVINILVIQLITSITKRYKINNSIVNWFVKERTITNSGQIIKMIFPSTIPWKYVFFGGVIAGANKVNIFIWYLLFFISITFHFVYLFILAASKRTKILQKKNSLKSLTFTLIFNGNLFQQWFNCMSNFIIPFFIIFQNPLFFIVAIAIFNLIGVIIATKRSKWKLNGIILSLYPNIFHFSFVVFYLTKDATTIGYAAIINLATLLFGCLHNLMTIVAEVIAYFCNNRRQINKVSPIKTDIFQNKKRHFKNRKAVDISPQQMNIYRIELSHDQQLEATATRLLKKTVTIKKDKQSLERTHLKMKDLHSLKSRKQTIF